MSKKELSISSTMEEMLVQFVNIIEHCPGYIYWKDKTFKYKGCNANMARLLHLKTPLAIVGKTDEELPLNAWQSVDFAEADEQVIKAGSKSTTVNKLSLKRDDGNCVYLKTERIPLKNQAGEVEGVFVMAMDITDEKIREDQLLQEQRDSIIAYMPGYIYWKNKNSEYMGCNNNLVKISGLKDRSEIVGKTDYDFEWGEKYAAEFIADDQEVMHKKRIKITEHTLPIKRPDGNYYCIRSEKIPLYNKNHEVIGILGIAVDVTSEKIRQKETHIAHTFVEDILYNFPGLVYWKNKKSQYMGFNKNVLMLSGLSREELLGKTDKELNWGGKEAESFQKDDQEVMETGQIKVMEYEIPIKRLDGNYMIVRTEKTRLFDREGRVAGVLGVAMDITDLKILEKRLQEERDKAEAATQIKKQFIANMEHDIRTPFCGIWGMANILYEKEEGGNKKEWLFSIAECAKELLNYCNDILDFSKIEAQDFVITEKKFDLHSLLLDVLKVETPPAKLKNLFLKTDYDTNLPKNVFGDRDRLYRILLNLISNAIKFTNEGEINVEFKLAKKDDKQVIIQFMVTDTGIGIPQDKQEYIYEKFSKISPSNQGFYKGVGVGLTIVKQFIFEMSGEIEIVSEPGNGSKFICTIPFRLPLID